MGTSADSSKRFDRVLRRLRGELAVTQPREIWIASAPGRTELAGNHTDHNRGRVLAASVDLESVAAVCPREDSLVRIASEGYPLVEADLRQTDVQPQERGTTAALLRGVASGFRRDGYRVGGFDATIASTVRAGSGLSSSASIEVLFGVILDEVYNGGRVGPTRIAEIGRYAENTYFGKPCGLMDQLACATGGVVAIDFADPAAAAIERIDASFEEAGLALLVVDTGASHADLTDEYAAIPADMRAVAATLGGEVLRDVEEGDFYAAIGELRPAVGDRAVCRAIHFFDENARVERMVAALRSGRMDGYLRLMADSGRSSGLYLQNCAPAGAPDEQGVVLALALTEHYLNDSGFANGAGAACRVHGGGFAGTIQVLLPADRLADYRDFVSPYLGEGAVTRLRIRKTGADCVRYDAAAPGTTKA